MKYFYLLLLLLLCTGVRAQNVGIYEQDSTYYAVTITITDNGTDRPDVRTDTTLLGTIMEARHFLNVERRRTRNAYNRQTAALLLANYERADREYIALGNLIGWDMDSITTARLARQIFPDTFIIVVDVADIPDGDLADYTTDSTATGRINVVAALFLNVNGRYRIEAVEAKGRWPLTINSMSDFDLGLWLGAKTNFYLAQDNTRRQVFIPRSATRLGSGARIIIQQ